MSRKYAKKIDDASTSFERWRLMLGLTQAEAANKLGKQRRTVQKYELADKKTGKITTPDYVTRVAMALIAQERALPTPWPE